ncbi:MAG: ABC-type uncharacterized transport system permease subunit [Paracoccaceae bacterium]
MADFLINWLSIVRSFAVPFALAALGLIICERSGVLNLGAEGFMLVGAVAGVGAIASGYPASIALIAAALAGVALGIFIAFMVAGLRINHVISGLAIVFLAQALTSLIATQQGWTNKSITGLGPIPFGPLRDIPVLGRSCLGKT